MYWVSALPASGRLRVIQHTPSVDPPGQVVADRVLGVAHVSVSLIVPQAEHGPKASGSRDCEHAPGSAGVGSLEPCPRPTTCPRTSWLGSSKDEPPYRVRQVWDGLHARVRRPEEMTELPAALRGALADGAAARAAPRCPPERRLGRDDQVALDAARRRPGRDRADALSRPGDGVRLDPGRLRHGLPVLRHRPGRLPAAPEPGRDRRAGGGRHARRPAAAALERRLHGDGGAAGELRPGLGRRGPSPRRHGALGPPPDAVDGRASCRASAVWPPRPCRSTSPCRSTPPTTRCATSWCRSTAAIRLTELAAACAEYVEASGRRLSIEWALIDGVNDRDNDAAELAAFARPLGAHVNLIPLNPTPGYPVVGSTPARVRRFRDLLGARAGERHDPGDPGRRDRRRLRTARCCGCTAPDGEPGPVADRPAHSLERVDGTTQPVGGHAALVVLVPPPRRRHRRLDPAGTAQAGLREGQRDDRRRLAAARGAPGVAGGDRGHPRCGGGGGGPQARRRGLPAWGWRIQTLIVGFPSLLALRRSTPAD